MIDQVPPWIQAFVLVGIALVVIVVSIRILYEMTKDSRDRTKRAEELADRLRERFDEVRFARGVFGPHRVHFKQEGRAATAMLPSEDELVLRLDAALAPKFPAVLRTRGAATLPFTLLWEAGRLLPRMRTFDPLVDDTIAIFAGGTFGAYLRELALDGIPAQGKPTGLAESLIVLRRMPGVRRFEVRMSPADGFQVSFRMRAEDLMYRPDELEAAVHHAWRLYDLLVLS